MNRPIASFLMAAALAAAALPAAAQQPGARIGFVSTERIMRDSGLAKHAQTQLQGEFAGRDRDMQAMAAQLKTMQEDLQKNGVTMSESERAAKERKFDEANRDFQRKQREYREDVNQRRNEELSQVIDQANRIIRQIAESEKYDIIFQEAAYANPRIDITDKVIKALEGSKPAAK